MTLSAVATRYANALADVVTASGSRTAAAGRGGAIAVFRSHSADVCGIAQRADSPRRCPASRKKAVVGRIADALQLSRIARNFLFVLVDHRRIASLTEIIQASNGGG